ncbi:hypothetical protein ACIBEJ_42315 [Nonomuraea sp. NPDC050790]|uniref:hypothetical protein n=1 Tax=Nonomuraea sp. NPDC050790 TaxID=3364371 RepID=UPI00379DD4D5
MAGHFHAYLWTGIGEELRLEEERRTGTPEFPGSPLPPMRTADWLARPRRQVSATHDSVADALAWLDREYTLVRRNLLLPADEERIGRPVRLANATESLGGAVDVQWGFWLTGGRFASLAVVCCPNRSAPHPCPLMIGAT